MNCLSFFRERLTPRVSTHARIFGAALVWSVVSVYLVGKGMYLGQTLPLPGLLATLALGLGAGWLKSCLVFDRAAGKIIAHICSKPDQACLGGLFSIRNWLLIGLMIFLGHMVSFSGLHPAGKVWISVAVGSGLGISSRRLWAARACAARNH